MNCMAGSEIERQIERLQEQVIVLLGERNECQRVASLWRFRFEMSQELWGSQIAHNMELQCACESLKAEVERLRRLCGEAR
jgi:hypothetical protein